MDKVVKYRHSYQFNLIIMIKKIFDWFVWSSANRNAVSLSVKSLLIGYVPIVLTFAGFSPSLSGLITADTVHELINALVDAINGILLAISSASLIYGFLRKVWITASEWFKAWKDSR